jgi:hypothetical protein
MSVNLILLHAPITDIYLLRCKTFIFIIEGVSYLSVSIVTRRTTKQKHNTICAGHHYTQASTNNVNKTRAFLQTTGGKDEPQGTLPNGTQNGKTHNRTTQKK